MEELCQDGKDDEAFLKYFKSSAEALSKSCGTKFQVRVTQDIQCLMGVTQRGKHFNELALLNLRIFSLYYFWPSSARLR